VDQILFLKFRILSAGMTPAQIQVVPIRNPEALILLSIPIMRQRTGHLTVPMIIPVGPVLCRADRILYQGQKSITL
jgi:hypothetical protein